MGIEHFWTFFITTLIFMITPGIDTFFILNKSIGEGHKAGIYASFGIICGVLAHTSFAALGLSLLIARSALAFAMLKYAGAAYLLYLGIIKIIRNEKMKAFQQKPVTVSSSRQNFFSGFVTNVLNPKVALFFLAFFPQFISPSYISSPVPFFALGVTYALMSMVWFCGLSYFAAAFSAKLLANEKAGSWLDKISGLVFILMGLKIAFTKK